MKGLTDIPGIRVGHLSDFKAITGCTAILCEGGAVAGVDVRGSATGSQELDVLNPLHVTDRIHGVCLAGGSAYGLEAASGVRRFLERRNAGFHVGRDHAGKDLVVPIVPAAILFDLHIGDGHIRPDREMGEAAAAAATDEAVAEGCVGAGTGATIGKLFGMPRAMKSGLGTFTIQSAGVLVSALVAVNALGDVRDPHTGKIVAGARQSAASREFVNTEAAMIQGATGGFGRGNTTLAVVATNAKLSKVQATKLAALASLGVSRSISPVNTMSDGDMVFALALGDKTADIDCLGTAAAEAVSQAILRAVRSAKGMGGLPGYFE
jgi:L-aminopeptidase/D-esterase-like protein